jgi:hypothetical protein
LLVSWCVGDRCGKTSRNEDRGISSRFGAEDRGWSSTGWVLGGQRIEILGDAVCSKHRGQGDEECEFLGLTSKPRPTVSPDLATKPVATGFPDLASKLVATILVI